MPIILSCGTPPVTSASNMAPIPAGSAPTLSSSPLSSTCETISATSATSSPTVSTIVKSPCLAKSLSLGASDCLRSSTNVCAQAWFHSNHWRVLLQRPSTASPNKSSSPPPSMPTVTTSIRSSSDSSVMLVSACCSQ